MGQSSSAEGVLGSWLAGVGREYRLDTAAELWLDEAEEILLEEAAEL
jgi:hypothetical protein